MLEQSGTFGESDSCEAPDSIFNRTNPDTGSRVIVSLCSLGPQRVRVSTNDVHQPNCEINNHAGLAFVDKTAVR